MIKYCIFIRCNRYWGVYPSSYPNTRSEEGTKLKSHFIIEVFLSVSRKYISEMMKIYAGAAVSFCGLNLPNKRVHFRLHKQNIGLCSMSARKTN